MKRYNLVYVIFALAVLGSIVKIFGGFEYGSRALFIDALTSMANLVALGLTAHFLKMSLAPPDKDHPYGHYRVALGGPFSTLIAYAFVGGIAVTDLVKVSPYHVSIYAAICAGIGLFLYLGAILLSRKLGGALSTYAVFTWTEVLESSITIAAALGGAIFSYLVDYVGAIVITAFIFYEIVEEGRKFLEMISDITQPQLIEEIVSELSKRGLRVKCVRIRRVSHSVYQGDITIELDPNTPLDKAHQVADEIENLLRNKYRVEAVVHVEPRSS
ncbi:MAG: cation diffusion facilitator family transporter [Crenarchaeota archaeon]|nr:cation diffusion facilitator family transporter [Thermoproteota archaeon]